jgi:hypothetical protein
MEMTNASLLSENKLLLPDRNLKEYFFSNFALHAFYGFVHS